MNLFENLQIHMMDLDDPRLVARASHKLIDIMVIGVVSIICGAESWYEMENFGHLKEKWFRKFLKLPNGIPSHDTFSRLFGLIDPKQFELCFMNWVNESRSKIENDTICIDGKISKGTMLRSTGQVRSCLSTVSAFSTISGVVLGQAKSNGSGTSEVSAAKELLDLLDIKGLTVVGDAGIGRESVVRKIREKKANYVFPVKKNVSGFYNRMEELFKVYEPGRSKSKKIEEAIIEEKGHGREETRICTIIRRPNFSKGLNLNKDGTDTFEDLNTVGRLVYISYEKENRPFVNESTENESNVTIKRRADTEDKRMKLEIRYFITNLQSNIEELMQKLRLQWAIENQLHWLLDVSLGEDSNRTRNKVAAQNLATVRKIAINLVKQDSTVKAAIKTKIKMAGWDEKFLEHLLFAQKLK